jgi:8-oxo-dGTP pyrophosphatase MutT (NUDIX family)
MTERPDWMAPKGRPWTSRTHEVAFDNPWLSLTLHDAVAPTGAPARYAAVRYKNLAIGVLPLFEDGTLVLVGQHRFPLMDYSWELPEGGAPLAEDPLEGARRELREEAGLEAAEWREIMAFQLSNSVTDERGHCYLATGLTAADREPDETEDLKLARVPFREALGLALNGEIKDMITLAALLRAYHMAREGELPEPLARAMLG